MQKGTGDHKSVGVAKGFSIRIPAITCPAFRSSERIRLAPLLRADATMRAWRFASRRLTVPDTQRPRRHFSGDEPAACQGDAVHVSRVLAKDAAQLRSLEASENQAD